MAAYVPDDARTLVRVNGATQVVGGLALASGRPPTGALLLAGSLAPSTIAKHPFWSRSDASQRAEDQHQFLKNALGLLGGVLLASRDTEGRPSLAWWAQAGGKAIAKTTGKASDKLAKRAEALTDGGEGLRRDCTGHWRGPGRHRRRPRERRASRPPSSSPGLRRRRRNRLTRPVEPR